MGAKGYVFIKLRDTVTPQTFLEIRRQLEAMDEVTSFDNVIDVDWFDILARVNAGIMVTDVANQIRNISGIANAQPARVLSGPEF